MQAGWDCKNAMWDECDRCSPRVRLPGYAFLVGLTSTRGYAEVTRTSRFVHLLFYKQADKKWGCDEHCPSHPLCKPPRRSVLVLAAQNHEAGTNQQRWDDQLTKAR